MSEALRKISGVNTNSATVYRYKPFGKQLKEARKAEHLTQEELGAMVYPTIKQKSSARYISDLETNAKLPTAKELEIFRDLFKRKFITATRMPDHTGWKKGKNVYLVRVPDGLGEQLTDYKKEHHLTQVAIANKLGVCQNTVWNLENRHTKEVDKEILDKVTALIGFKNVSEEVKETPAPTSNKETQTFNITLVDSFVSTSRVDKCFLENVIKKVETKEAEARLCNKVGIVPGYFRRSQNDIAPITLDLAMKVSKELRTSIEDLCRDNEKERIKEQIEELKKKLAILDSQ